jgi:protein TonB
MRLIHHYFPFFIIAIIMYGCFFYYNRQSPIVPPLPLNSGQQSVQLQFVEIAETLPETTTESEHAPIEKKPESVVKASSPKTDTQAIETISLKDPLQIKVARENLQKTIRETPAISDAELKAQLFESELQLDSTTPADSEKSAAESTPAKEKAIKRLHPVKMSEELEVVQQEKTKPVFKKQPSPNSHRKETQGVLQEAIVVSGNTPIYPRRAILRNQQGRVVVKLTVTSKGKALDPQIMTSSGHAILDNAVLNFISKELFMPAHRGEEKVRSEQIFSFRFQLR